MDDSGIDEKVVSLVKFESRLSAVETLVQVHRDDLKALSSSLNRIEAALNHTVTTTQIQQVEFSNLVKNLRDTTRRNAWTVGFLLSGCSVAVQILIAVWHL